MKKSIILTSLLLICIIGQVFAETVKEDKARVAAQNWYRHYAPDNKKSASVARFSEYKHNERTAFYIYNFDQGGFVLVSANDAVTPVLGYGFDHSTPDEITNEAVKGWFDKYARQIDTAFVLNLKNEEMSAKWQEVLSNKMPAKNGNSVGPLLTTTWDQGWPYNAMCPEDPNGPGGHTWAGCTATAMAQILKYWNYPEGGVGYYSYVPRFNPQYGSQSVNFNETDYTWEEMENTASSDNYEAISTLLYHAGVSADMDYSTSGSGAHLYRAVYGFKRNFDFSDSIIQIYRSEHNDSAWLQIIKSNINHLRPVLMEGYNETRNYGHAWVCDGYDQNDYLHVNWGWSGSLDGYWQFNNLFPGWFDLRYHQSAITNLFPKLSILESRIIALKTENNYEYHFIDNALGNPTTFNWDFGDSTYSDYQNPIHLYENPGNYLIKLVVQKNGIFDTVQELLNVYRRPFLETSVNLQGNDGRIFGVDYNNDNKHDIVISGHNGTRFYDNINNSFELNTTNFPQMSISPCYIEPVDLDKSNQPQFFLTGSNGFNVSQKYTYYFKLEEQNITYDTLLNIQLPSSKPFSYADFNNDGKTDLLLGNKLYMNFGNLKFVYVCDIGNIEGASAWCDFNLDGFFDVAIGDKIFKNNGEFNFSDIGVNFSYFDHLEWGDFNSDGYPDLLVGNNILLNENGINFSTYSFELNLPDIQRRVFSRWADIDTDGDLDVISLISGINYNTGHYRISTKIYNNLNNNLYFISDDLQSFWKMSSIGWIDYNHDNNLDILLTGYFMSDTTTGNGNNWVSKLYSNNSITNNQPPSIPENLQSYNDGNNGIYLSWNRSFDDTTPQSSLSYNVYIYNAYDSLLYVSPLSDTASGFLKTPKIGNAYFNNFLKLNGLLQGTYYWSVQAIDNAFSASPFATKGSFYILGNNLPEFINVSQKAYINKNIPISSDALLGSYYDIENDSLVAIRIDSLPQNGMFIYDGNIVNIGQEINLNDIENLFYFTNSFTDDHCYISPNDSYNWGISSKFVFKLVLFEDINLGIDNTLKEVAWGDYNNDGYIDFTTGTTIYKNVFGSFEDIGVVLTGEGVVNWIDFDSDGDLDLFVGENLYQNEGNDIFIQFNVFSNLSYSAGIPCDFNSDNQVDYFRTGRSDDYNLNSYLYENSVSGHLTEVETNIPGVTYGNVTLADINNSGCPEIAICGMLASNESITQIFKYENQLFSSTENQITGVYSGDINFGDFDKDGYPDLIFCGLQWNIYSSVSLVYRNNGISYERFTNNGWNPFFLPQVYDGIAKWVDLNSDGYPDIILGGYFTYWVGGEIIVQSPEIRIYMNQSGVSFIEQHKLGLPELSNINCSFSDFDNDGFIDLLLSGKTKDNQFVTHIYRNGYGSASMTGNLPPSMPTLLNNSFSNGSVNFTWNKSDDDTTPQDALSYNVFVRRNQDSVFIVSPLADTNTGFRKIVNPGNASMNNFYKLDSLSPGTYYWSVQAIDNSFAGGPFAPEQSFTILPACSSSWSPLPNLQFNMQIVAQILIDDQVSLNPNDVFGAFVGDECRGIASPDPALDGKIFLTIGSNVASGEQIELKIWNSSDCSDCNAIPGFEFVNQGEIGTFLDPYQLRCGAIQDITFGQGYTWFSLNVNPGSMTPASLFTDLTPCYDDRVIGQTSFALFTGSTWVGSLTNLGMDKMYRMKLCSQQSMSLMGDAAPLSPISLSNGYTWLGYQPQQCQSVSAAMAGLSPGPSYDDRVIGQNSFALFTGSTWVGSLTQMCPGKGYVIKLANAQTLSYPESTAKDSPAASETLISPTGMYPAEYLQHQMMVTGQLISANGTISLNEKDVVYASINGEIRGMAHPIADHEGLIFLSIGSNEETVQPISFTVWLDERQELIPLNESLSFEPLASFGDFNNPFIFTLGEMVGVDEMTDGIWIGESYPNPFTEQTIIPIQLTTTAKTSWVLYNNLGQKVGIHQNMETDKGSQQILIDRAALLPGIYILSITIQAEGQGIQKQLQLVVK